MLVFDLVGTGTVNIPAGSVVTISGTKPDGVVYSAEGTLDGTYRELAEGARQLFSENLFETVRKCYCDANKDYLKKQISIAAEYLTDKQKAELRQIGIDV